MTENNGSVKVTKEKIYEEVQSLKSTVEIFISKIDTQLTPEFKMGACPYKDTLQNIWRNVGIIVGIATVIGGALTAVLLRLI